MERYSYDRRQAADSGTPSFDAVVKANLGPKLQTAARKALRLADIIEDTLEDRDAPWGEQLKSMRNIMTELSETAYKTLDTLRPVLQNGRNELEGKGSSGISRNAESLSEELRALDIHRREIQTLLQKEDIDRDERAWKTLSHRTAMSVQDVAQFYNQLKKNYGSHL